MGLLAVVVASQAELEVALLAALQRHRRVAVALVVDAPLDVVAVQAVVLQPVALRRRLVALRWISSVGSSLRHAVGPGVLAAVLVVAALLPVLVVAVVEGVVAHRPGVTSGRETSRSRSRRGAIRTTTTCGVVRM